ncbi:hypothetical protein [Brevundimonas sp.]|uniref:hypothetical protein n=1 Tax=Brevundimonas sp. TaxID=1871086 RepID=UPI002D36F908|nr:hypothetical protein [Brevundimonas sp.]HYC68351.1 hypothetical protein [Brevundimonas sp.]
MMAGRALAAGLAAALTLSSCAHVGEGDEPLVMTERVMREACIPFVVDGIDADEVGRRLGGWWSRNFPDPFTPPQGPIFRRGGATVQVIDGRSARTLDGRLTTRPMRHCRLWLGRTPETGLVEAVASAVGTRAGVVLAAPGTADGNRKIIACIPSGEGRIAVVSVLVFPNGETGANVHETSAGPRNCVG